jgi:hypothetical protein
MTTEEQLNADALAAQEAQQTQPPEQKQGDNTAAMDEAAKEASLMLLDRLLGEEKQAEEQTSEDKQPEAKKPEEKPKQSKKTEKKVDPPKEELKAEEGDEEFEEERPEPKPRRNRLTAEKVAETASRAAAEAAAETYRRIEQEKANSALRAAAEADRASQIDIPEEAKEEIERLREVQRLRPTEYRGRDLAREYMESAKSERDYEKKWRKENPGVDFSWDDDEHKSFIDDNSIEVEDKHLKEADRSILKEQAVREAEERIAKRYGNEIEEVRRAKAESQLAPIRQQVDSIASKSLLEAVRPDLVESYDTDRAKVVKDIQDDPIAMEAVTTVEQWSIPALDAAVRVINNPNGYSEKSREVQTLVNAALRVEDVMKGVPREERPVTEDGRKFSTMRDYANMPQSQKSKYYTVQDEQLVPQLIIKTAQYEASRIKSDLEKKAESYAKRMGFTKSESNISPKPISKPAATPSAPSIKAQPTGRKDEKVEETTINGVPRGFWESIGLPV